VARDSLAPEYTPLGASILGHTLLYTNMLGSIRMNAKKEHSEHATRLVAPASSVIHCLEVACHRVSANTFPLEIFNGLFCSRNPR
jgi:hypothetical protein